MTMKEISDYLNEILEYDWGSFNQMTDMLKQLKRWNKLFDKFDEILSLNSEFSLKNFDKIQEEINSNQSKFSSLRIKGRFHRINSFFIIINLTKKMNNFKFRNTAKINSCNCLLRKELKQNPYHNKLTFLDKEYDGYYYSDIFVCNECHDKWSLEFLDDGTGRWI